MKKLFTVVLLLAATTLYAQKDVTKFLGIPVDGSKLWMISQLKLKGFKAVPDNNSILIGEFNGYNSEIHVVTNGENVWRVMVSDVTLQSESAIIKRFNNLCRQFEQNPNYISFFKEQTISNKEDVSYEMLVHNKQYEAVYYQKPVVDSIALMEMIKEYMQIEYKYTEKQLEKQTKKIKAEIAKLFNSYMMDQTSKKSVWFKIANYGRGFGLLMYYDNVYNQANGEEL